MRRNDGARRLTAAYALLLVLWGMLPTAATSQVDETPPVIRVTHGGATLADGALFRVPVTPVIEVTDESTVTIEALLDGATFTSGTAVSGEGSHVLLVTATDAADNEAQLALSFTIDTTPPSFASVQPPRDSLLSASQVTLTGTVVDAVSLTIDGQAVPLAGNSFSAGPYTLAEGQRSWTLTALDLAGNSAEWVHRLVRDATPPTVVIAQPAAGALLGAATVTVSGTVADPHLDTVTVNGTVSTLSGSTFQSPPLPLSEGTNQLSVEARDRAGNAAQASRTVEVDTQAPVIAVSDPAPGTLVPGDAITVSGSVVEPHLDRIEVNGFRATVTGSTWSVRVPLVEGVNTLLARAVDRLGKSGQASVAIIRDSSAPAIHIEQPDDGSYWTAATVHVTGTVETESGLTVTVNGVAATVEAGAFAADVPLVEGENRLIARVTDSLGNQGAHTRVVYRDTTDPTFVASDPASGALAVDPEATFRLTFSEPLAPVTAGWSLATAAGAQLAAVATQDGATLTLRPSAPLPAQTELRLVLTTAIADRAGNALAEPPTLTFTTADNTSPAAPVLDAIAQARLCASRILLAGSAEPGTRIGVTGGASTVQTGAAVDGRFSVEVPLLPDALNRLEVTATDLRGNRSPAAVAEVVQDCRAPSVLGATFEPNAFTIRFSEPMDASTIAAAIAADGSAGALAGSASLSVDGATARYELAAPPPAGALRLQVSQTVRDRAGNALVYPYARLFRTDTAESFVAGRVIDQHTGRPLQGALVLVAASDGVATAPPQPQQTTAADGRFQLPVAAGTHLLLITRPGYTPSLRLVATSAGRGTDVFDPRLTPAGAFVAVASGGGVVSGPDGLRLDVPSGALAAGGEVSLTALEEQALPALLPFGWSPQGAAWVALRTGSFASPATLTLPVGAPDGAELILAKLDLATLQWKALGTATVTGGTVVVTAATDGGYAALLADEGATAPPAPVVGSSLGSAPAPTGAAVTAAAMSFVPGVVLPAQRSVATVSYTTSGDVASGLPLTLTVREELTLLDQTVRREAPYEADLVFYRSFEGAPRSRFGLVPSTAAQTMPISMGAEDVTVAHYVGGTLQGNVLGAAGGVVGTAEGDRIEVPAGALAEPTAVTLDRQAPSSLPQPVPAGTELIGVLAVDLGGRELALPAGLGFELGAAPPSGASGLLLELVEVGGSDLYRAVAALVPTATGWATAPIDAADLPWPGVRRGGRFALVRLLAPVGFFRGHVFAATGAPRPGAVVRSTAASWVAIADADGRYVLPSPLAAVTVTGEDFASGETAASSATVAQAGQRIDLDLQLGRTAPEVVATTPADGAVDVIPGIQPTVRFSKPVDTASLPGGIRLLEEGEDEVAIEFSRQGDLVTVSPQATLRPGTTFELRIGTGVRDLLGTPLETPVVVTFTTRESVANAGIDLSRIHLVEPTAAGQARIIGRAGAVPHDSAVFAENTSRLASTVTVEAAADGSFELSVEAGLGDTVLLHVLLTGANEVVVELGPFMTSDLRSAFVDEREARFTTGDGIAVVVPAGAFDTDAVVTLTPRAPAEIAVPLPTSFTAVYGFDLSFGGVSANKALQIAVPAPAGSAATGRYLLSRVVDVFGEPRWMMQDLMRLQGATITTEEAPQAGAPAAALPVKSGSDARSRALANDAAVRPKQYVPGAGVPGSYLVSYQSTGLYFLAFPLVAGLEIAIETAPLGMVAVINREIERLLTHAAILIPALLGQPAQITVRDLTTGYRLFEGTFEPAADGEFRVLPPDNYSDDHQPPYPVTGGPLRFFTFTAQPDSTHPLANGIEVEATASNVVVRGEAGSAEASVALALVGLDDSATSSGTASADGSFTISVPAVAGHRYLLAVSAEVGVQEVLEIGFNEGLGAASLGPAHAGIKIVDPSVAAEGIAAAAGHPILVESIGSNERIGIRPERGWLAGKTYQLRLGVDLVDAQGNFWPPPREVLLQLPFKVAKSAILSSFSLERVRDVARLGSLLFVATEASRPEVATQGLVVLDASNPTNLKSYLAGNPNSGEIFFNFPLNDPVRGVAIDPHGRVLVSGGGVRGPGQLKILDPQLLNPAATAQAQFAGVWRGSTVISDVLGGTGSQLLEGTPRRLTVLSQDHKTYWTVGQASLPIGIDVQPATVPPGGGTFTLTVSGMGGTAGAPVTLRNLDRGTWKRVDALTNGDFVLNLEVEAGDRLELLRNQKTYAYVTVQGAGITIVDVNNFYGRDDEVGSSVLGNYTGYEENLELCDQPVSDISTALLDLAALWDPEKTGHELSVLGLVGFRGLLMLTSRNDDPDELVPAGEGCASFAGTNHVVSLEVLQGARIVPPAPSPNVIQADAQERDWALVTHRQAGLLVYDITDRTNLALASRIPLPEQPSHLAVDRDALRAYVSTYSGKLLVVDLTSWRSLTLVDRNEDGRDDRVLEEIPLAGITSSPLLVFPELGLAFAGGLETAPGATGPQSGATSIAIGGPRLAAVTRWRDGEGTWRRREITRLAPYGTPTAKDGRGADAPDLPATFQIYAGLPGWLGERVRLEVESVGPGGTRIAPAGDSEQIEGLPPVALVDPPESDPNAPAPSSPVGDHGLVLTRLASDPWQEGFNLYRSEEVAVVADLRASHAYARTEKERAEETCPRCERGIGSAPLTARELLSGDTIRVRLPQALRRRLLGTVPGAATEPNYTAAQLAGTGLELASVRWDLSPAVRQEPAINPSTGVGDAVPGTLLHSGEMTLEAIDLFVKGRGLDYAFARTYRNQTVGAGPLGPGWDFAYHERLRELPNGDVEYFDGTGRREKFARVDDEPIVYKSPKGRFVTLKRTSRGWVLLAEHGGMARFDRFGLLSAFVDANKDGEHHGTELVFSYDAASRLVRAEAHGRAVTFEYDDDGLLTTQRDHTGREVKYEYDTRGRLEKVTSPAVTVGERKFPLGLTTIYSYAPANGNLQAILNGRGNLTGVTDPKGQRWLEVTYTDADNDGRSEEATQQAWGSHNVALTYDFEQRTTQVRDRRGIDRTYVHDADGHPMRTELSTAAGAISLVVAYDEEGLVKRQTLPGGRLTELEYFDNLDDNPRLANYGRRQRGTIQKQTVTPAGDSNGSAGQMVTDRGEVHPMASRPQKVTNPQGATTRTRFDSKGALVGVIVGEGGPSPATTLIERNDFGQPECILDANGHVTRFAYHEDEEGVRRGYLREMRVSEQERACGEQAGGGSGADLVTTYEVDERGNVKATVDPRGVRYERVYNELDQLVEERLATTPASDSQVAPALGYVDRYLYDENGNLEEAQLAYGRSSQQTKVRYVYGLLNEVREVHREITPGGSWSVERRVYDENGNVRETIGPDGQTTRNEYDERNLLASATRGHGSPDAATEHFERDRDGQLIARWIDNPDVEDDEEPKWKTELDGYGRLMKATDPLGNYTLTSYPDNGRRVLREHFDGSGGLLAKEEVESDDHGRPKVEKHWRWDPATAEAVPEEIVRENRYDGLSNVTEVLAPVGGSASPQIVSKREYDFAGRIEAVVDSAGNRRDFELDAGGNVIEEKASDLGPGGAVVTSWTAGYDALNRAVERRTPAGVWRSVFDARGNAVELEQPADGGAPIRTSYDYDGLGRLTEVRGPNGITVTYGYDASSRLRTYEDALGQTTTWDYDALDRRRSVQYPDGASDVYDYDRADNLVRHGKADGTTLTRRYDAANRLTQVWVQQPGQPASTGPAEVYEYDGLGNLTQATAGPVLSSFRYDSLGQLLRETTGSSVVAYEHDAAGNRTRTAYPAGGAVFAVAEANANRPGALHFGPSLEDSPRKALYRYVGADRVAAQELGAPLPDSASALAGTMTYDASQRLQTMRFVAGETPVFDGQITWYPRGLQQSVSRGELNGAGMSYDYDEAGRLETARRSSGGSPDAPVARTIAGLPDRFGAGYDVAENLLFLDGAEGCTTMRVELPRDAQGRNRPQSVNGVPLEWDRNGNLKRKGNRYFHYDHRDRLVKVTDGPNADTDLLVASYVYDALDRRLSKTVGDGTKVSTRWAGWQPIERYRNDTLTGRRVFGRGLDEIVSLAIDVDGDGLETAEEYLPVYDASGNLSLVTRLDGTIVERYDYSPYGERFVIVNDFTPPRVEQVRLREGEIWIELSEEALLEDVKSGLALRNERANEAIPFEVLQPVKKGPEAGRRLVIRLTGDPEDESWPQVGDLVWLSLPTAALVDTFGNRGEIGSDGWMGTTTWSLGDVVVTDRAAPRLDQICVAGGKLELTFSEEPSETGLAEVLRLDGAPLTWTVQGDRYSARSTQSVTAGSHALSIGTGELDLAGTGLAEAESETFTLPAGQTALTVRRARAPGLVEQSSIGNEIGFHGLERDPETGLVYARHRYYDPEIGRFISADPLGYVDGPSMYSYAGNNPIDFTDPLGLEIGKIWNGWLSEEEQREAAQGAMSVDDGFKEALGKGTAWASLAALSLVSGPIGWTALGGFVLAQMEGRYEQIVDSQDRPADDAGWQAIYYGGTDMLGIGPAIELGTRRDRVTGDPISGWGMALRVAQMVPVLAQLRRAGPYTRAFAEGFRPVPSAPLMQMGGFGGLGARLKTLSVAHQYAVFAPARRALYKDLAALELESPSGWFSKTNVLRMAKGKPPLMQVEVRILETRDIVTKDVALELHHRFLTQRMRSPRAHEPWNLELATPWGHEAMDEYRHLGYEVLRVIKGPNSF